MDPRVRDDAMTPEIESLYGRIGQAVVDSVDPPFTKGYVSVEMADDFGSVGMFVDRGDGLYDFEVDESGDLFDLFAELRERCITAGLGAWSQATFAVEANGRFSIDFGFDDISEMGAGAARRDAWVKRVLGQDAVVRWGA